MAARVNTAIRRLANDEPVFYIGSHAGAELTFEAGVRMADTWADYINIGMEHGPLDLAGLDQFMKGMASVCTPTPAVLVELPFEARSVEIVQANAWQIRQLLTLGVHGFMLCHAERPEPVAAVVEAMRYTFRGGTRGSGGQGAAAEIWGVSASDYLEVADPWPMNPAGELLLGLKIENRRALENAFETTAVPGVAFAEWGPADMSMSHGYQDVPPDFKRPELQHARQRVFDACMAAGIPFLEGCTEDNLAQKLADGVRVIPGTERLKELAAELRARPT
ncbi:MAG: hypothetical protein F4X98_19515 [Gammaproteobacteria bacterium]|nr:hypothetical protein [Gammaproteobacteria bacterium]